MTREFSSHPALSGTMRVEEMRSGEEVLAMVGLHERGWGAKRIAQEFGCARNTVRRYLREGGVVAYRQPERRTAFDGLDDWLRERFFRHDGNADVIRQELESEHGIVIGLRSVELRVRQWRRELKAQKRATVRFETAPGHQLQIDFGDTRVWIGGERVRIHVFVGTLGYSRRMHIRASPRQRQTDWFEGMEGAFLRFGGVPAEVLIDNAKALVEHHDAVTREVRFNARLHAFARYWASHRGPVPLIGPGRRGKTNAASATSRRTRSLAAGSRAGWRSRRIWIGGRARLPTGVNTAPPALRPWNVLPLKLERSARFPAGRRSGNCGT
ncbi:transposase [Mesorhizobium loti]|uniref:Transposase n=1 Tax=Rhizobium loti TaxID=381 RepID=A0A8E3B2G5_RHILI|nr:transposase [Mesorhizobium loti]